eukprot:6171978-Pleurochrysis_carterae.AAC.1
MSAMTKNTERLSNEERLRQDKRNHTSIILPSIAAIPDSDMRVLEKFQQKAQMAVATELTTQLQG